MRTPSRLPSWCARCVMQTGALVLSGYSADGPCERCGVPLTEVAFVRRPGAPSVRTVRTERVS
jgi:hypothetical protein